MISSDLQKIIIEGETGEFSPEVSNLIGFSKKRMSFFIDVLNEAGQGVGNKIMELPDGTKIELMVKAASNQIKIHVPPKPQPSEAPYPTYIRCVEIVITTTPEFLWYGETGYVVTSGGHLFFDEEEGARERFLFDDAEVDDEYGEHYHIGENKDTVLGLMSLNGTLTEKLEFRHPLGPSSEIFTILPLIEDLDWLNDDTRYNSTPGCSAHGTNNGHWDSCFTFPRKWVNYLNEADGPEPWACYKTGSLDYSGFEEWVEYLPGFWLPLDTRTYIYAYREWGEFANAWGIDKDVKDTYYSYRRSFSKNYQRTNTYKERINESTYESSCSGTNKTTDGNNLNHILDKGKRILNPVENHRSLDQAIIFYPYMEPGKNDEENSIYVFSSSYIIWPYTRNEEKTTCPTTPGFGEEPPYNEIMGLTLNFIDGRHEGMVYIFYHEDLEKVERLDFDVTAENDGSYGYHILEEEICWGEVGAAQREETTAWTWTEPFNL